MKIRNVAIIAHVDHGKTTIVDGLLKQSHTFRENAPIMQQQLIMDSNAQEVERGITILAKNVSVTYGDVKINIIDTPGHADFGGEVERTLNMADGALLVIDAQEGPMPQTKFVLRKALELNLKIIVVVNKVDKPNAIIETTNARIADLFLDLATRDDQLLFPTLYAWSKQGKSWKELPEDINAPADFTPIFQAIVETVPEPQVQEGAFQMLVTTLDWDNHKGKYAIGRINRGQVQPGQQVAVLGADQQVTPATVDTVFITQGLTPVKVPQGSAGDIVSLTGIPSAGIGDTITDKDTPEALPRIQVEDPTLSITIGPNTSPFRGQEGTLLTGTKILARIKKELQTNVAMKFHVDAQGKYVVSGRGELHLSVFLETLRREGFELEISKPTVMTKMVDGVEMEPVEELTIDVDSAYVSAVQGEVGKRRGLLVNQETLPSNTTRMVFTITTRGLLGLRGALMTLTKGTAVVSSTFLKYQPLGPALKDRNRGVIVAHKTGKAVTYGLAGAHAKGPVLVEPQTQVYEGMIVGINGRNEDITVNVCREKQLTNNRSVGEDVLFIPPATTMSLEQKMGFIAKDELLEITPLNLRMRKKILNSEERRRAQRRNA